MSRRERKIWQRAKCIHELLHRLLDMHHEWKKALAETAKRYQNFMMCVQVTEHYQAKMEPFDRELRRMTKRKTRRMKMEIANGYPMWLTVYEDDKKGVTWGRRIDYPAEVEKQIRIELLKSYRDALKYSINFTEELQQSLGRLRENLP